MMADFKVWRWILVTCFLCTGPVVGIKITGKRTCHTLESLKTYPDQKTGAEAEYAFLTMDWGIVNYDREQADMVAHQLTNYEQLVQGHKVKMNSVPLDLFDGATVNDKISVCRTFLDEPSLYDNRIYFDDNADPEDIVVVQRDIIYLHFGDTVSNSDTFVQCPVRVQDKMQGKLYMSAVEQTEAENSGHYFIFVQHSKGRVSVLMRTMLESGMSISEIMSKIGRAARFVINRILDVIVGP